MPIGQINDLMWFLSILTTVTPQSLSLGPIKGFIGLTKTKALNLAIGCHFQNNRETIEYVYGFKEIVVNLEKKQTGSITVVNGMLSIQRQ